MVEETPEEVVLPTFDLSPDMLAKIKENLGPISEPPPDAEIIVPPPVKRPRGRPKGSGKNQLKAKVQQASGFPKTSIPVDDIPDEPTLNIGIKPAPLTKVSEKDVAARLMSILTGGTGVASNIKPYLQMTDEEAEAISNPLASYLVRNADTIPIAGQILENYDLLAITLGVLAYVVRVYHDRSNEVAEYIRTHPKPAAISRMEQNPTTVDNGQVQRETSWISSAYGEGNGSNS